MVEGDKRSCSDCGATKTPLWRNGPAGPRSLCNACGIRYRKKEKRIHLIKRESSNFKLLRAITLNKQRKMGEVEEAAFLLMSLSSHHPLSA